MIAAYPVVLSTLHLPTPRAERSAPPTAPIARRRYLVIDVGSWLGIDAGWAEALWLAARAARIRQRLRLAAWVWGLRARDLANCAIHSDRCASCLPQVQAKLRAVLSEDRLATLSEDFALQVLLPRVTSVHRRWIAAAAQGVEVVFVSVLFEPSLKALACSLQLGCGEGGPLSAISPFQVYSTSSAPLRAVHSSSSLDAVRWASSLDGAGAPEVVFWCKGGFGLASGSRRPWTRAHDDDARIKPNDCARARPRDCARARSSDLGVDGSTIVASVAVGDKL